jgi:hypothetical protein
MFLLFCDYLLTIYFLLIFRLEEDAFVEPQEDLTEGPEALTERPAYHSVFRRADERSPEEIAKEIEERHKYSLNKLSLFFFAHFIDIKLQFFSLVSNTKVTYFALLIGIMLWMRERTLKLKSLMKES